MASRRCGDRELVYVMTLANIANVYLCVAFFVEIVVLLFL